MKFSLDLIAKITNGQLVGNSSDGNSSDGNSSDVSGFEFNSTNIKPNDMFIALSGGNTDGHNYLLNAKEHGAASYLIEKTYFNNNVQYCINNLGSFVVVEKTYNAMLMLASYAKNNYHNPIVAITGSVGKTSLKEMFSAALANFNVFKTLGNYNNNIGVPFSLLSLNNNNKYAIVEMGMNSIGEIRFLSEMVKPQVAIITTVSNAHYQFFSSTQQIAAAKAEIMDGMAEGGDVILNYDDDFFEYLKQYAQDKQQKVVSVSLVTNKADCFIIEQIFYFNSKTDYGFKVTANIFNTTVKYTLHTIYKHNVLLSLFVFAFAKLRSIGLAQVAQNLKNFKVTKGRGKWVELDNNNLLIDDSYNANYQSMSSGLNALGLLAMDKILILGEMLELGRISEHDHLALIDSILVNQPQLLILVGKEMEVLFNVIKNQTKCIYFTSVNDNVNNIIDCVNLNKLNNSLIFIKGSYGSKVHIIADKIREL